MWENQVGRSRAFWDLGASRGDREIFGGALEPLRPSRTCIRAVNRVRPNLIRVESDEVTYNLHIMLRFDLERAMLRGDLERRRTCRPRGTRA